MKNPFITLGSRVRAVGDRPFARKTLRAARRIRALWPLTTFGALVTTGGLIALIRFGLARIDLVLLVAGAMALLAVTLALVSVFIGVLRVRSSLRSLVDAEPVALEAGRSVASGLVLPRFRWLPIVLETEWQDPKVPTKLVGDGKRFSEIATPQSRAFAERVARRVVITEPFGLASIELDHIETRELRVLPAPGKLRTTEVVRQMAPGSDVEHPRGAALGDRLDMREYVAGDPIRFILWKVFARTRELMVRTPERALSPIHRSFAYLVCGEGDEPSAAAVRVAMETRTFGADWIVGVDGVGIRARTLAQGYEAIVRSARIDMPTVGNGLGLAPFLTEMKRDGGARAVVFVPGTPGPWLERVVAASRLVGQGEAPGLDFVVCIDRVGASSPATKTNRLREWFLEAEKREGGTDTAALTTVLATLERARGRVVLVERETGRVLASGAARALREAAA